MIEAWIPLTIAAAFLQNIRSSLQVSLKGRLSNAGATCVRFFFAVPVALVAVGITRELHGVPFPEADGRFLLSILVGGTAQVLATACLLMAATLRNFAVATAYSKTEPILAAVFGLVLLAEPIAPSAGLGIAISVAGVIGLGVARGAMPGGLSRMASLFDRGAVLGITCGALFGLAAVSYRAASLSLQLSADLEPGAGFLLRSTFTLAWVLIFQSAIGVLYLAVREPGELGRILTAWRPAALVGLSGALASIGWFTAMTLENAAYVRTLGQVELLFALGSSRFFLGERLKRGELLGVLAVLAGLLLLIALN